MCPRESRIEAWRRLARDLPLDRLDRMIEQVPLSQIAGLAPRILGGQIRGANTRLFMIYSAGNFVESSQVSPYFQIGESKYGKPIIDRVVTPSTPLDEVAKCALVSIPCWVVSRNSRRWTPKTRI